MVRMPVLALFAESLGASPERIGVIVSVSTLTGVFLKLPSGALSDIYGRRMLLRVGVIAFGVPPFFYPFISDLNVLTWLRLFHGLATAIFAPSALATVAELYRERRGAALGTYTASTQSGALLGPFIGGYLAFAYGFSSAFLTAGLFGCAAIVMFYSLHLSPPPPRLHDKGLASVLSEMWKGFSIVARNRKVLVSRFDRCRGSIANGALMAFLPLYGISVGLNAGEVGLLFTIQSLTSFISKPIMGRVSDRMGRQPLIMLGLVICAATFVSFRMCPSWPCCSCSRRDLGSARRLSPSSSSAFVADSSRVQDVGSWHGHARHHWRYRTCERTSACGCADRQHELCRGVRDHCWSPGGCRRVLLARYEEIKSPML